MSLLAGPPLLNGRCTSLLRVVVSEMTYTVSSGTLNSTILYYTTTFYRATLCVSAVFAVTRCLSVRLCLSLYPDAWRYR